MAYEFYIRHLGRNFTVKQAVIYDFLWLSYRKVVNAAGTMQFAINADDVTFTLLEAYDIFEVYWRNSTLGVDWHKDFEGIYRTFNVSQDDDGINTLVVTVYGALSILGYRQVAYPAGVDNFSSFASVPAETIAKRLVSYNCTALATVANGRLRNGDLSPNMGFAINVIADAGGGNVISKTFHKRSVIGAVSEVIAPVAGGDFSLVMNGTQWDFDFHVGQLGADKTSGANMVEFSEDKANIKNPILTIDGSREATVAISAGQGRGTDRNYQVVTGVDYALDNDIEISVDARNEASTNGVIESANVSLEEVKTVIDFDFQVIQTKAVFYSSVSVSGRKTYTLGDLVVARYMGITQTRKVTAVNVGVRVPSNEDMVEISIETQRP